MKKLNFKICLFILILLILTSGSELNAAIPFDTSNTISIVAAGDIMLANRYVPYLAKYGYNFPFEYTHDITSSADIAFANLEAPISKDNGKKRRKQFTFKAHPDTVKSLLYAGFDVLNIANNHIMDFGRDALSDTIRILEENNIQYVGGGKNFEDAHTMRIIKVRGSLIGFLGFSKTYTAAYYAGKNRAGITSGGEGNILKLVKENSKKVDILIVSFHWGKEYTWKPGSFQISLARRIIKNGAKAVLGHHPHCIQPVEKYKDGIIAYSLGNFAFGSFGRPPKRKADKSLMLKIHLDKKKIAGVEVIPLDVYNYRVKFQSRVPENKKLRDEILNYIKKISARFNTAIQIEDGRGYIPF